jgi:hypothetical protein
VWAHEPVNNTLSPPLWLSISPLITNVIIIIS